MNFKSTRMWPVLLDMTKEESMQCLRNLELEAYAHLVSALRAQGPLNPDKRKLLKDTSLVLNITQDRHKAEIRRAINDEKLNTIAYHVSGLNESIEDWAQEGRRTVPLIPRLAPQTVYSAIADDVADCANQNNKQLPPPALTERKRVCTSPQILPETTTNLNNNNNNNNNSNNNINNNSKAFRISDLTTKADESNRKRKLSSSSSLSPSPSSTVVNTESSLAQHLLHGPAMKMNRNEQIYRHRTKQMLKEQSKLRKYSINGPKLQNNEETIEQIQNEINSYTQQSNNNENQVQQQQQRSKLINPIKTSNFILKPIINPVAISTNPGPSFHNNNSSNNVDNQQEISSNVTTMVVTTATTTITTTLPKRPSPLPQKLIVVSNPQSLQQTNSNMLQKGVSLPLVKNLTMKNLEKFKIVTTTNQQQFNSNVVTNLNSLKHKVLTVKTNPMKKVIPLSQLLNSKGGIKVLPIGGKIIGKALTTPTTIVSATTTTTTTTTTTNPVYIVNTVKTNIQESDTTTTNNNNNNNSDKENGKSTVLGEILKASGVTNEDFDAQIEEFHILNNNRVNNNNKEIIKKEIEGNGDNKQREIEAKNEAIIEEQIIVNETVRENTEIIEEIPEVTTVQDNLEMIATNSDGN